MKLSDADRLRHPELCLQALLVEEIKSWWFVRDEDVHFALIGSGDDGFVVFVKQQRANAIGLKELCTRISRFGRHWKPLERGEVSDAGYCRAKKNGDLECGIGSRKIQVCDALGSHEDGVYDIKLTGLHPLNGIAPIHAMDLGGDPRLFFPGLPLIDDDALQCPAAVPENIGRIIVIHHHADFLLMCRLLRKGGHADTGEQKYDDESTQTMQPTLGQGAFLDGRTAPRPPTRCLREIASRGRTPGLFRCTSAIRIENNEGHFQHAATLSERVKIHDV